jgi:RNA polymerase sigma-70 factor (ECF subfamily)
MVFAGVSGVTTAVTRAAGGGVAQGHELRDLYAASYSRLVGTVGAVCRDRHEAEEAVQDAFVRLMGVWPKVSRYDDPEAWVRKVALRQVSNRRRKALNGIRAALRHGPPADVPEPTPVGVDADRALAALPEAQRAVVVLHRLGWTPTPSPTRSASPSALSSPAWRAAAPRSPPCSERTTAMTDPVDRAVDASIDAHRPAVVPPFEAVEARKRSRDRRRGAGAAMLSAAAVVAVAVLSGARFGTDRPPADGRGLRSVAGAHRRAGGYTAELRDAAWIADSVSEDRRTVQVIVAGGGCASYADHDVGTTATCSGSR